MADRNWKNANHLLNFRPVERPKVEPNVNVRKKNVKVEPFIKERFLQANYKFLVSGQGDYNAQTRDPDLLVDWDSIEQVLFGTWTLYNCPICLDPPIAAKISKCGHVFCWPCILRHLVYQGNANKYVGKCPMCFEYIQLKDMKSVIIQTHTRYKEGQNIRFVLLKRAKNSTIAVPRSRYALDLVPASGNSMYAIARDHETLFARFAVISSARVLAILEREEKELQGAAKEAASCQDDSLPYIISAQELLMERKVPVLAVVKDVDTPPEPPVNNTVHTTTQTSQQPVQTQQKSPATVQSVQMDELSQQLPEQIQENKEEPHQTKPNEEIHADDNVHADGHSNEIKARLHQIGNLESQGEFFYHYQADDGQQCILHPLNMKILLYEYGSFENLPDIIEGKIVEVEDNSQTEITRKKFKSLNHVPMNSVFQLIEIDLRPTVSKESLKPFMPDIHRRVRHRQQLKKKHDKEKLKEQQEEEERMLRNVINTHDVAEFPQVNKFSNVNNINQTVAVENDDNSEVLVGEETSSPTGNLTNNNSAWKIPTTTTTTTTTSNTTTTTTTNVRTRTASWPVQQDGGVQSTTPSPPSFMQVLKSSPQQPSFITSNLPVRESKTRGKQYILMSNSSTRRRHKA